MVYLLKVYRSELMASYNNVEPKVSCTEELYQPEKTAEAPDPQEILQYLRKNNRFEDYLLVRRITVEESRPKNSIDPNLIWELDLFSQKLICVGLISYEKDGSFRISNDQGVSDEDYGDGFGSDLVTTLEEDVVADLICLDKDGFILASRTRFGNNWNGECRRIIAATAPHLLIKLESFMAGEESKISKPKLHIVEPELSFSNELEQRPNESKEEYQYRLKTILAESGGPDFRKKVK